MTPSPAARLRLLIAEDHFVTRMGLKAVFGAEPDVDIVAEAENGPDAIALYREHRPDIAVIDLRLPGKDGVEIVKEIRAEFQDARIVILTSSEGSEGVYRALQAGARAYLMKDAKGSELVRALRDVHAGKKVLPPEVAVRLAERMPQSDLSPRELEVLRLVADGKSNKRIADALGLSEATVRTHVSNILSKLGVDDRTQAATEALRRGILPS
jgi:two-component system, NarL family, response regulator